VVSLRVNRTHSLWLGLRRAYGLRRLLHPLPGWRVSFRLTPAAAPSSTRLRS
jgi:hypothetical protein